MRLIIFVKIPERVEPIPLDIIDDRPSQAVLVDILAISKLSTKKAPTSSYYLSRNGTKLNPDLELSQNGVKNGTLLELIQTNEQITSVQKSDIKDVPIQEIPLGINEESKSIKRTQKRSENQPVPGKKIDF